MNKTIYTEVAQAINAALKNYDDTDFKPRVSVIDTKDVSKYCDNWSLSINDELYGLLQIPGRPQDLFYADEIYVVGDNDLYIEPYNSCLFNLAVL